MSSSLFDNTELLTGWERLSIDFCSLHICLDLHSWPEGKKNTRYNCGFISEGEGQDVSYIQAHSICIHYRQMNVQLEWS